jgi:hypothetical protein
VVVELGRSARLLELLDSPEGEQHFEKVFEDRSVAVYRAR